MINPLQDPLYRDFSLCNNLIHEGINTSESNLLLSERAEALLQIFSSTPKSNTRTIIQMHKDLYALGKRLESTNHPEIAARISNAIQPTKLAWSKEEYPDMGPNQRNFLRFVEAHQGAAFSLDLYDLMQTIETQGHFEQISYDSTYFPLTELDTTPEEIFSLLQKEMPLPAKLPEDQIGRAHV